MRPIIFLLDYHPASSSSLDQLITNYENATNSIVLAVCGSGKTEISYAIIKHVIENGGQYASQSLEDNCV